MLFHHEQCLALHGCTSHCIRVRRSGKLVAFTSGHAKIIGPDGLQEAQEAALRVMARCVALCKETVRAEFPDFDVIMAFKVFNVEGKKLKGAQRARSKSSDGLTSGQAAADSLQRLSQVFGVDPQGLQQEFSKLRAIALAHHESSGCCNRAAWQHAFARVAGKQACTQESTGNIFPDFWLISVQSFEESHLCTRQT